MGLSETSSRGSLQGKVQWKKTPFYLIKVWICLGVKSRISYFDQEHAGLCLSDNFPSGNKWISAISCWELAKLVERGRIAFSIPVLHWIRRSLKEQAIQVADGRWIHEGLEGGQVGHWGFLPVDSESMIFRYRRSLAYAEKPKRMIAAARKKATETIRGVSTAITFSAVGVKALESIWRWT